MLWEIEKPTTLFENKSFSGKPTCNSLTYLSLITLKGYDFKCVKQECTSRLPYDWSAKSANKKQRPYPLVGGMVRIRAF